MKHDVSNYEASFEGKFRTVRDTRDDVSLYHQSLMTPMIPNHSGHVGNLFQQQRLSANTCSSLHTTFVLYLEVAPSNLASVAMTGLSDSAIKLFSLVSHYNACHFRAHIFIIPVCLCPTFLHEQDTRDDVSLYHQSLMTTMIPNHSGHVGDLFQQQRLPANTCSSLHTTFVLYLEAGYVHPLLYCCSQAYPTLLWGCLPFGVILCNLLLRSPHPTLCLLLWLACLTLS
eukprot:Gb_35330 [translate_table: standard]